MMALHYLDPRKNKNMQGPAQPTRRGRPRTITRERIADAGLKIGLPNITFVGVAAAIGVSHMALYKHVGSLEELKCLIAEEAFKRWQIPVPNDDSRERLKQYLNAFSLAVQEFVKKNPGVTLYVIRHSVATESMLAKINQHQSQIAEIYGITKAQAQHLLSTVAFHTLAASDTVYSLAGKDSTNRTDHNQEQAEMQAALNHVLQMQSVEI